MDDQVISPADALLDLLEVDPTKGKRIIPIIPTGEDPMSRERVTIHQDIAISSGK